MAFLNIKYLYVDTKSLGSSVLKEVEERFPNAELTEVASHWRIPELNNNPELLPKWAKVKREYLVVGNKSRFTYQENGRSTDFIGPSVANGCASACTYCYVARRKGYANPVTIYSNREEMIASWKRHLSKLGTKPPSQTHPTLWTYDIGCNNDISIDSMLCDTPRILIEEARGTRALLSFATKSVNLDMLNYDPQGNTRIRFSLMPESMRKVVDVGTDSTTDRIDAINDFVDAGYEVHLNFSPIIIKPGGSSEYIELLEQLNDTLTIKAKEQAKAEIIMLTHNQQLHELNLEWHPKGEALLWRPDIQERKTSLNGQANLRYDRHYKADAIRIFKSMLKQHAPWIEVRYAF